MGFIPGANASPGQKRFAVNCGDASRKAVQYEGANSIESAFEVLGGAAIENLMSDPEVTKMMEGLDKYLDGDKLAELARPVKK